MADQEDTQVNQASHFHDAPSYLWANFTLENIERIEELRDAYATQTGRAVTPATRLPGLPGDLASLQAPPESTGGRYTTFGGSTTLEDPLPSLEEQGIQRLGPDRGDSADSGKRVDAAFELKKLSKSLLLNFLELSGILYANAGDAQGKLDDLRTLFINMHHTINEWRPHQAREALITLLQTQLERTKNETMALREVTENGRRVVEALGRLEVEENVAVGSASQDEETRIDTWTDKEVKDAERVRNAEVWASMDALFD